jgi:hypothetical protein
LASVALGDDITTISGKVFALFAFACFTLAQNVQAVVPPPDGHYANRNTAEGKDALFSLTTGEDNTALGFRMIRNDGMQPLVEQIL